MKTKRLMVTVVLSLLLGLGLNNTVTAQLLVNENFEYVAGQLTDVNAGANVSGGNWVNYSGTSLPLTVSAGSLTYTGYASSGIGNKIEVVNGSAEDAYRPFTTQIPDANIYAAFVMNVSTTTGLVANTSTTGDYTVALMPSTSTTILVGRISLRTGSVANTFNIGLRATSSNAAAVWDATDYPINTPVLVVLCYNLLTGNGNDIAKVWINPTPGSPEPVANIEQISTLAADPADIARFAIRQGTSSFPGQLDGIRIATTWADAVASDVVTPDVTPPVVDTAWATSLSTVKVTFNEVVDNITAETLLNYTGLVGIGTAVLNTAMDTVTLTLSTPLIDNVADTVCIANVEDTAGNAMAASQCFRLLFTTADLTPPVADTAWAVNLSTVKVVFSEAMDNVTAETTTNYTGLPGIATAVLSTSLDTVTLTLSTPLTFGIPDTLIVSLVEDVAGNPMAVAQNLPVIFGVLDVTPPTVITAWPANLATVKVKFSEAMDNVTAQTVANYTGLAGISSATLNATEDTVTLALSTNLISGIADTLYIQSVEDLAGNAMTAQQMFVLFLDTATTTNALVITEIMYNPAEGGVDSTEFIEILNNDVVSVNLLNYVLKYGANTFTFPSMVINPGEYALVSTNASAASNFYGVTFLQITTGGIGNGGATIVIYSPSGLLVDTVTYDDVAPWPTLADEGGYSLSLCDPSLDNNDGSNWGLGTIFFGTVNTHDVYADPGQGCVTPTDIVPPVALSASLTDLTTAVVTFNEALNLASAQTTANYTGLGAVSSAVLTNDTVVTLTLSTPLVNAQNYILEVTGISDLASNVMTLTYQFPLMLDTITSINEFGNSDIQIFPNPANDAINLTGVSSADRIEVYSNMGMLVMSHEADGNDSVIIETSVLSNGLYYINIRMKDGAVETKPVVIIR